MPRSLWLLMLLALGVYLACLNTLQVGQHVDDASYIMLAKSLLSGQGYRQIAYPDAPPETKYPPLLPLLLAPCLALAGGALGATRLPALLCAVAAIPVLWALLGRCRVEGATRWLITAVVALHPLVVGFAGMAMTEAPSLLLTWLVLLLWLKDEESVTVGSAAAVHGRETATTAARLGAALGLGLLVGLGLLLRTDFLALGVAGLLWLVLRRRWLATAATALGGLLPLLPWWWYCHGLGNGYLREAGVAWWDPSPLPLRLWHSLVVYLGDYVPQVVTLVAGDKLTALAAAHGLLPGVIVGRWLATALLVWGAIRLRRRLPALLTMFVVVRLAMLLGFARVTRYLLPLLPLLLLYLRAGVEGLGCALGSARARAASPSDRPAVVVLALLLLFALGRDALLVRQPPRRHYPDVAAGGRLIRDHTPPGSVVYCTWSARSFWLYAPDRWVEELTEDASLAAKVRALSTPGPPRYVLVATSSEGKSLELAKLTPLPRLAQCAQSPDGRLVLYRARPVAP